MNERGQYLAGIVTLISVERRDWPNSCLGLERSGEFCAQAIFAGYRVTMSALGNTYSYRTNLDGTVLRAEN